MNQILKQPLVRLADLGAHDCRWPYGDPKSPTFGFCGRPVVHGKSYCGEHHALSVDRVLKPIGGGFFKLFGHVAPR